MKRLSLIALAATCIAVPALAQAQPQETITVRGADPFGASAIQSGDLGRAEALLTSRRFESNDPVRLLNLGAVYWLSGRHDEAVAAWRHALAAPVQYDVQTAGGRMRSTDELAREALAAAEARPIRTASRLATGPAEEKAPAVSGGRFSFGAGRRGSMAGPPPRPRS